MANLNTFADVIAQQNNGNPLMLGSAITETQFALPNGQPALLTIPLRPFLLNGGGIIESTSSISGHPFRVRAVGTYMLQTSATLLLGVYASTALYSSSSSMFSRSTTLANFGSGVRNGVWLMVLDLMWDAASGKSAGGENLYSYCDGSAAVKTANTDYANTGTTPPQSASVHSSIKPTG